MSKSDVDMDSEKSDERKLYKLVKNKLKDILLYVDSTSYAIASKTVSDTKIENPLRKFIFIYMIVLILVITHMEISK